MKVSLNLIKRLGYPQLVQAPVDQLVARIGSQLGEVESVVDWSERYQRAVVVRIVDCDKHPDADRLQVCRVDDGGVTDGVERDADGLVQVVCGAPNARAGILAIWLPPGSVVPSSHDEAEPFRLEARKLRGVVSQGMLASPQELALGDGHDGILEIDPSESTGPGQSVVDLLDMADHVIDIENKMFTHRPDCFGVLGVARELAGIQGIDFTSPDWYLGSPQFVAGEGLELTVDNQSPAVVPRLMALAFDEVSIADSPLWLKACLIRSGLRPINNIVDLTNYIMLVTGQPLHAYDYDKVARLSSGDGAVLAARQARPGESLKLLNGKTIEPRPESIVIATDQQAIGLAGVMGGADTEVDDTTKRMILEVANFDMYSIRRTSMHHGLFTDAVSRFNKGQSPLQNDRVMAWAVELIGQLTGAKPASHVMDHGAELSMPAVVEADIELINSRLGLELPAEDIAKLLSAVEFDCRITGHKLRLQPPFWRTDIAIAEDVIEEVGRLYGYDRLPLELPRRSISPARRPADFELKSKLRRALARYGASEVLTYSFVHEKVLRRAGQDAAEAYRLTNALSPDLQHYRLTVLPSLLDKVHMNLKAGHDEFALFEIGKGHRIGQLDDDGLPQEVTMLDLVYAAKRSDGAAYYQARFWVDRIGQVLGFEPVFKPLATDELVEGPFDAARSASVHHPDGRRIGLVGEFTGQVIKAFKLPVSSAGFSLDFAALLAVQSTASHYRPLGRFPGTDRDLTLQIDDAVDYGQLAAVIDQELARLPLDCRLEPVSIYRPEGATARNISFRISLVDRQATISAERANQVVADIVKVCQRQFGAQQL